VSKALLDTSTYIDMQRAKSRRREPWAINTLRHAAKYASDRGKPLLSTMAVMEIRRGIEMVQKPVDVQEFLRQLGNDFEFIGFNSEAACIAGEIYAKLQFTGQGIGIYDVGIAAIALQEQLVLVNSSDKHFRRVVALGYPLALQNWRDA
jgi:tRNA(fMet)-specific endonuclease VapC